MGVVDIDKLVHNLRGSSKTLEQGLEVQGLSLEDMTDQDNDALDEEVFKCDTCSWWCDIMYAVDDDGDRVCTDCFMN